MISRSVCNACRRKWQEQDVIKCLGDITSKETEWECPIVLIHGGVSVVDLLLSESDPKSEEVFVSGECPNYKKHARAKDTEWAGKEFWDKIKCRHKEIKKYPLKQTR